MQKRLGIGFVTLLLAFLFLGFPVTKAWAQRMRGGGGSQGGFHSGGGGFQGSFGGSQGGSIHPFQGRGTPSGIQGFDHSQHFQHEQFFGPHHHIVNGFPGGFPADFFFGSRFFPNGSQVIVINAPSYEIPPEQQCGPDTHWDATTGQCMPNTPPSDPPAQILSPSGVIVLRPGGVQEPAASCPKGFIEQIQSGQRFCVDPEHPETVPLR